MSDLIEKIAKAIHETDSTTTTTWEELCDLASRDGYMTAKLKRGICLTSARAALSAIEQSKPHADLVSNLRSTAAHDQEYV